MNILIPYTKFDSLNIFFLEKRSIREQTMRENDKKSIDDTHGNYTKIIYSTKYFTMNGIYLTFMITPVSIHKNIVSIIKPTNEFVESVEHIESSCLDYYKNYFLIEKKPVYYLLQQLKTGSLKFYKENHGSQFFLKISGIWDTELEYGITYKIIMA